MYGGANVIPFPVTNAYTHGCSNFWFSFSFAIPCPVAYANDVDAKPIAISCPIAYADNFKTKSFAIAFTFQIPLSFSFSITVPSTLPVAIACAFPFSFSVAVSYTYPYAVTVSISNAYSLTFPYTYENTHDEPTFSVSFSYAFHFTHSDPDQFVDRTARRNEIHYWYCGADLGRRDCHGGCWFFLPSEVKHIRKCVCFCSMHSLCR